MEVSDPVVARAEHRVGTLLAGKWMLDELLGVGGMAAVYAATHRNSKRVAIKLLHPELSSHPGVRERFLREGYAANNVRHPGVATVHDDVVAEDGSAFLVMDLVEGEALSARCERKGGTLVPAEVLAIMDQVLDVLAAAHDNGVVHRDLKPENVFITREGGVKVLDFGIARVHEPTGATPTTQSGTLLGTPAFMAPEQARGTQEDVDGRTDIWAAGATMFTLMTGSFVHMGRTPNEIVALAITRRARSIATVLPMLHPAVVSLVDRALAYEKSARWSTPREMQEELRRIYDELATNEETRKELFSLPAIPDSDPIIEPYPSTPAPTLMSAGDPSADPDGQAAAGPVPTRTDTVHLLRRHAESRTRWHPAIVVGVPAALLVIAVAASRRQPPTDAAAGGTTPGAVEGRRVPGPSVHGSRVPAPAEALPEQPAEPQAAKSARRVVSLTDLPSDPENAASGRKPRTDGRPADVKGPEASTSPPPAEPPGTAMPSAAAAPPRESPPAAPSAKPAPPAAPSGGWDPFAKRL